MDEINDLTVDGGILEDIDEANTALQQQKPMGGNSTSKIWTYFTRIEGTDRCRCNYCPNKTYVSKPGKHGTSSLWNHFKICKNNPHRIEDKKQRTLAYIPSAANKNGISASNLKEWGIRKLFRSSLSPKMVEALLCGRNWLKAGLEQIDVRDSLEYEPGSDLDGPSSIVIDE